MMTNEKLVNRLEWWLAYFNNEADECHPDFVDDPYGFDESAMEADLRAAIDLLREQDGERIQGYITAEFANRGTRQFTFVTGDGWPTDERATLILDPQEPDLEEFKRTMKEKGIPFHRHYMHMKFDPPTESEGWKEAIEELWSEGINDAEEIIECIEDFLQTENQNGTRQRD